MKAYFYVKMCLFFFLAVCLLSCNKENIKNRDIFFDFLRDIKNREENPQNVVYVIIPTEGCKGCISPAMDFLKRKINDPTYQFIITEITDVKQLKTILGKEVIDNDRLQMDFDNIWRKYKLDNIYPLLVMFKNGSITQMKYIDPSNKEIWNNL